MSLLNEEDGGLTDPRLPDSGLLIPSPGQGSEADKGALADQLRLDAYLDQLNTTIRDDGLERAERGDPDWANRAFAYLKDLPQRTEVTADDVRSRFGPSMAVGSVFRKASRTRLIEVVGLCESKAVTRHKGLQRVWRRV